LKLLLSNKVSSNQLPATTGRPDESKTELGWVPEITVQEMCAEMVEEDLIVAKRHKLLKLHEHKISVPIEN
jgi:GDPmannose 4,6-dehydratase